MRRVPFDDLLLEEIGKPGPADQQKGRPAQQTIPCVGLPLLDLLLQHRLLAEVGIDLIFRAFQIEVPLKANHSDGLNHLAMPQSRHCRLWQGLGRSRSVGNGSGRRLKYCDWHGKGSLAL